MAFSSLSLFRAWLPGQKLLIDSMQFSVTNLLIVYAIFNVRQILECVWRAQTLILNLFLAFLHDYLIHELISAPLNVRWLCLKRISRKHSIKCDFFNRKTTRKNPKITSTYSSHHEKRVTFEKVPINLSQENPTDISSEIDFNFSHKTNLIKLSNRKMSREITVKVQMWDQANE